MSAEITILPLEEKINQQLVKANVTDAIIQKLKDDYMSIKVTDRETYDEAEEARKTCKNIRVTAKKICVAGREDAVATQKAWVKKETEITAQISEVEDHLSGEAKAWKEAEDKRKEEERMAGEMRLANRQQLLSDLGVLYHDKLFTLGDVIYEHALVKDADDDLFNGTILPAFQAVYDRQKQEEAQREQERIEAERKQKEEAERQRLENERMVEERRQFLLERNRFRKEKLLSIGMLDGGDCIYYNATEISMQKLNHLSVEEFDAAFEECKADMDAYKEQEETEEKERQEENKKRQIWRDRWQQLKSVFVVGDTVFCFDTKEPIANYEEISSMSDDQFNEARQIREKIVTDREIQKEAEIKAEIDRLKQEAILDEREKHRKRSLANIETVPAEEHDLRSMPDDQWESLLSSCTAAYFKRKSDEAALEMERKRKEEEAEKERQRKAAEQAEIERQQELSDGEKWREWKVKLKELSDAMPDFANRRYKKMKTIAKEKFDEIQGLKAEKF